jgi:hypothetical protein
VVIVTRFAARRRGGAIWVSYDAQVVSLPEAMEGLVDYYRRISGEHPDWDDYRHAMQQQRRVLVRVSVDVVGPATPASRYRPSPPRLDRRRFTLWLGVRAASAVGRLAEMVC